MSILQNGNVACSHCLFSQMSHVEVKDRQLLIRGVLEWLHKNGTGSLFVKCFLLLYKLIERHSSGVSNGIKHVVIYLICSEFQHKRYEKCFFLYYFLNKDVSLNILLRVLKIYIIILDTIMEGTLSQIFYLGPSFHFM